MTSDSTPAEKARPQQYKPESAILRMENQGRASGNICFYHILKAGRSRTQAKHVAQLYLFRQGATTREQGPRARRAKNAPEMSWRVNQTTRPSERAIAGMRTLEGGNTNSMETERLDPAGTKLTKNSMPHGRDQNGRETTGSPRPVREGKTVSSGAQQAQRRWRNQAK